MEEFSEDDLKLLSSFANENDISMEKDDLDLDLDALEEDSKIAGFTLKPSDVQVSIQNCLKDLNKKRMEETNLANIAAQKKDREGSAEHLKMKQIYEVELARLSKIPQINEKNSDDIYNAVNDSLLIIGLNLDDYLPEDEGSMNDLESQFEDELNALQGIPKTKRKTVQQVEEFLEKTVKVLNFRIADEMNKAKLLIQSGNRPGFLFLN
jgi:hypothetical protein